MKVEVANPSSNPASILKIKRTIIEARKYQHKKLLHKSTDALQPQPLLVTPDKFEPNIEKTTEEARILINDYSPKTLHRWQQSIVNQSSLKTIVIVSDTYLYYKFLQQFYRRKKKMPELKDLIEMGDQTLEELMGGEKKKEETKTIRQSMIQHNVLPLDSQIVFQIDLLGLPEWAREILVGHNIKTIESICQVVGKELKSDEKTITASRFVKNRLLKFIQELAEWEKMNPSPESLPISLKQFELPVLEEKKQAGLPRRSTVETKKIDFKKLNPEEKLERKRQKIINKLSAVNELKDNPTGYINQKLKDEMTVRNLFNELREKGLKIKTVSIFYQWLKVLGIPVQSNLQAKINIYQEAKQAGRLKNLTNNQQTILEKVFGQGLTIFETAHKLSEEKNKTVWYQSVHQTVTRALNRLIKLKNFPEKKELTDLAYLQVMFPKRLGTRTYYRLKKNHINTLEELKSILPKFLVLNGIGPKGTQACVDLLKHFFPEEEFVKPLLVKKLRIIREKSVYQPLPQIDQQVLEKWRESRQNEAKLDKIGLPDNIFNVFQEAGWTLKKIIDIPDDNLLKLLGGDIRKLITVRKALTNYNIVSKNSNLTTEFDLLGLPTITTRALIKADIKTLKELYSLTEGQLLSIRNIGFASLGLIKRNLTRLKNELEAFIPETKAADSA